MIKVAIVDDHKFIVESLAHGIDGSGFAEVVGKAYSVDECFDMLAQCKPDVVLLDVSLNESNSINICPDLLQKHPETKILILTSYANSAVISRAFSSGASGYIIKTASIELILEGIKCVASGGTFQCEETKKIMEDDDNEYIPLTKRELQILSLIVEGYTCKEIADKLFLSYHTVHDYYKYLRLKLKADNTAVMVKKVIEQKIL